MRMAADEGPIFAYETPRRILLQDLLVPDEEIQRFEIEFVRRGSA